MFRFFFFQAEDGIRDHAQSRGLGDVYKRQVSTQSTWQSSKKAETTPKEQSQSKTTTQKSALPNIFGDEGDDFPPKKSVSKKEVKTTKHKKQALFGDEDDDNGSIKLPAKKEEKADKQQTQQEKSQLPSLGGDDLGENKNQKPPKKQKNLFGGDDEEGEIKMPEQKVKPKKPTKTKKLFDDDEN
eukprot:TRINITY_DN8555_c0_g1_i4.p3 TRINITY_DN8555_c0_g1~~TRINITY_DN8555_c0_g1_i4.p3  ORF type:complete len:184 (+),score=73.53 TRINITY_DN8555_c0_g1_i4:32-583(+)